MKMRETFASRLRRLREESGLTTVALALAAGCSDGAIRQLERGTVKSPSLLLGVRLAAAPHVSPEAFTLGSADALPARVAAMVEQVTA